jgi:two-component system response regulator ResD
VLRRTLEPPPAPTGPSRLRAGSLVVDGEGRTANRDGVALALTVREFDLLSFLMRHPGRAFTRAELMEQVWGWTYGDASTVTVHIRRLREKVEPAPTTPTMLVTVWGVGYRFDPDGAADPVTQAGLR